MITAQIRANGGTRDYTGPTLAAIIRDHFGPDAAVVNKTAGQAERAITVPRGDDRIVVGSLIGNAVRSAE